MKTRNLSTLFGFTFILTISVFSQLGNAGQVYKWVDEEGNIHYSDKRPNNNQSTQNVKIYGSKQSAPRANPIEQNQALQERKQRDLEAKAEQLQAKSIKDQRAAQCKKIQENLQKIQENSRVQIQENGELRYLTPAEIEEKKAKYQNQLDNDCQQ